MPQRLPSSEMARSDDPYDLTEALAGDLGAWTRLVDEFATTIWHWARRQGLDPDEAEDVSQTVWYRLKDRGHTITDPRTLPAWLATTTRREAQAARRRRERVGALAPEADAYEATVADPGGGPADAVVAEDLRSRLVSAFRSLGERCRLLLSLCWEGRLSYAEMADVLGTSIGSIGPTRQRCLQSLRAAAGVS